MMPYIQLKSISFNANKFRKLGSIKIDIAPRITVIAGHNGIGKSTILGLLANGSQYNKDSYKSYFDKSFKADFSELFFINLSEELIADKKNRPIVTLEYEVNFEQSIRKIIKECSVSKQGEDRARIIPRTPTNFRNGNSDLLDALEIGDAAKIPIPTIYLGMSRMSPIGEYEEGTVSVKKVRDSIHLDDRKYIKEKTQQIISTDFSEEANIVTHDFKYSKKGSKVPEYEHHTLSISLGQDSLSSIITALASFKKAKRELAENYPGGLLIIDEIDAGFHPIAQIKLMELFQKEARSLNLQIILTTHSLTILKKILTISDVQKQNGQIPDSVIYFMDTRFPRLMQNPTYTKIKNDLLHHQENEFVAPKIKIYFEDLEAKFFFEKIIKYLTTNTSVLELFGTEFELIALQVGNNALFQLYKNDNYFKNVILIPDNDVLSESKNTELIDHSSTIVPLPKPINLPENISPRSRTPEAIIYDFIKEQLSSEQFWARSDSYTSDYVRDKILTLTEEELQQKNSREKKKSWFNSSDVYRYINNAQIIEFWCEKNHANVDFFKTSLLQAIECIQRNDKKC